MRPRTAGSSWECTRGGASSLKQTIGFTDLMDVYRKACHPENDAAKHPRVCAAGEDPTFNNCHIEDMSCSDQLLRRTIQGAPVVEVTVPRSGLPIYWRDGESSFKDPTLPSAVFYETGGFYDGAVRIWGADSDQRDLVTTLGNEHAVGDGTTPTP